MQEEIQKLSEELKQKDTSLTLLEARSWVELLWEDFEASRAKAGREYEGADITAKFVRHFIDQYGSNLTDFATRYPKYQQMIDKSNKTIH
ncbi:MULTISPECIES: YfhJ family protein [Gracilibacillus]|uniref:YfhJ family protein n=1 Tax=Gracilibacillus TaxID=74385 RepID=UPI0008259DFA|nr:MULTISPECIES: YfhJ family protein [Gracilibacillus]